MPVRRVNLLNASRITTALVVPTISEAIKIWDRLRIPKDASMATNPPKVKKRKITRFRPEKMLIKMAPNTVVKDQGNSFLVQKNQQQWQDGEGEDINRKRSKKEAGLT